jgi:predicted RNA-binding Zn ribbon-like protein
VNQNFKFVGGRLCLDFVNTVGGRTTAVSRKALRNSATTVLRDKIVNFEDLVTWGQFAAIVKPGPARDLVRHAAAQPSNARTALARVRALREALYRIFKSVVDNQRPHSADLDILNRELSIARTHEQVARSAGAFIWMWNHSRHSLDSVLWPVSRSAAELLTSADLSNVRQCGGDECGWMFLDTSRNRGRQWCDMKDCGNRAKVRRFRQRQRRGSLR